MKLFRIYPMNCIHTFMSMGLALIGSVALDTGHARADPPVFEAKKVLITKDASTLADAIASLRTQTGYTFDTSAVADAKVRVSPFDKRPFWEAVETLATETHCRITLKEAGKTIALRPIGKGENVSSISGPFRTAAKELRCRRDVETGAVIYELFLEIHWEPCIEAFRIDEPNITAADDDAGNKLTSPRAKVYKPVSAYSAPLKVTLNGLTRKSQSINVEGSVTVTAATEMLTFTISEPGKASKAEQKKVGVAFGGMKKAGKYWSTTIDLSYPSGGAEFESFETYWLRANEFTLIDANGKRHKVDKFDSNGNRLNYYFEETAESGKIPADWKGWQIEIRTPGEMRDHPVSFRLKGIRLP